MKAGRFKRILSYLIPVSIAQARGKSTPQLGLYLWQGRWQLVASTAVYSDGKKYRPLRLAFRHIYRTLPSPASVLVLGAGLGSAIDILEDLKIKARYTLVDLDEASLQWGQELHRENTNAEWICSDVTIFVQECTATFDVVVLDVFQDRLVPQFVTREKFLSACAGLLKPGSGILVFNYIINNEDHWLQTREQLEKLFRIKKTFELGINRIMILQKNV